MMKHWLALILLLLAGGTAVAEDLLLSQPVEAAFAPRSASFLIETREGLRQFEAALSKLPSSDPAANTYLALTQIAAGTARTMQHYYVLLYGDGQQTAVVGPNSIQPGKESDLFIALNELPGKVKARKEALEQLQAQVVGAEIVLQQLQARGAASPILQQMRQLQSETAGLDTKIETAGKGLQLLKTLVESLNKGETPYNFEKRERQLTTQLAALAQSAKTVERTESLRKSGSEAGVMHRKAMIEEAKGVNLEALEQELAQLKARRAELQSAAEKVSDPRP